MLIDDVRSNRRHICASSSFAFINRCAHPDSGSTTDMWQILYLCTEV